MGSRQSWRRCVTRWGICHWHEDAWVCRDCGDEFYPSRGDRRYREPVA